MDVSGYRARDLVRIPGLLSLGRLPLAALFPFAVERPAFAISLLFAAAATDVLDGWYARHYGQQTMTGAVLDGAMDKVFALTVVVTLVVDRSLSPVHAFILSAREVGEIPLLVRALWRRDALRSEDHDANALGKLATVLQFLTVVFILLRAGPREVFLYATGVCGALAALTYWRRETAGARAPLR